jgi:hypothetical protein
LQNKEKGVSPCGLAICVKRYLKAKEENYEKSNISPTQKYNLQKILLKKKPKSFKIL